MLRKCTGYAAKKAKRVAQKKLKIRIHCNWRTNAYYNYAYINCLCRNICESDNFNSFLHTMVQESDLTMASDYYQELAII